MSSRKRRRSTATSEITEIDLSPNAVDTANPKDQPDRAQTTSRTRSRFWFVGWISLTLLLGLGVFAGNGWLPHTDEITGKEKGWFGQEVARNANSWNPLAQPLPPTTQLSKEYIYASGSRLLTVEDANANAVPPADLSVWRPSTGHWYVLGGPGSAQTTFQFGAVNDVPTEGDYDGDGKTDFSVWRASTGRWYVAKSSDGSFLDVQAGTSGDIPVQADYDGDGRTDIAYWRPSNSTWYITRSSDGVSYSLQFGVSTDIPAPADYDGDGQADISVWRNSTSTFYTVLTSTNQYQFVPFTPSTGNPVSADYDGDGKANYALHNGANWIIMNAALTSTSTTTWGQAGDIPVQNDYDGDGKVDIAIWRGSASGMWSIKQTSNGTPRTEYWGAAGDIPVPAYYRR